MQCARGVQVVVRRSGGRSRLNIRGERERFREALPSYSERQLEEHWDRALTKFSRSLERRPTVRELRLDDPKEYYERLRTSQFRAHQQADNWQTFCGEHTDGPRGVERIAHHDPLLAPSRTRLSELPVSKSGTRVRDESRENISMKHQWGGASRSAEIRHVSYW